MLAFFKKFSNKNNETQVSEFYEPDSADNPNFLTDPDKLVKLLKNIEEASPLCTIIIDGSSEEFNSSILDVQIENKQIILDELLPKHGNALLDNKKKLKLATLHNGIRLAFNLTQIKTGSSRGIAYYKAPFPQRIYYPQRRNTPRVQIASLEIGFSGTSSKTNSTIYGKIFDLSRNGIGIHSSNRSRFQRGDTIKNCKIRLDGDVLNFDLDIRFVKPLQRDSKKTQIGGYFENLSPKNQKKLEYFVAALEREEIRNRKG